MKKMIKLIMSVLVLCVFFTGMAFASDAMEGHDMGKSEKLGDLIHESVVDGYMLSYYFMDLRDKSKDMKDMEKPHHIMMYVMDKDHKPVLKGKVGFMIKDAKGNSQKVMGMFMSSGFGVTANMKEKGVYTITAKAVLGEKKIMDSFKYEMK